MRGDARKRVLGSDAPLFPRKPRIIGITGKKRVGKDSLASFLVERHGFVRLAFADPLKDALLTVNPIVTKGGPYGAEITRLAPLVREVGWEAAKEIPEVRRLLQHFGEGVRAIDRDFWVNATVRKIVFEGVRTWSGETVREFPAGFVVTDVRYRNEADALRDMGAEIVRVVRHGVDDGDTHPSETVMDGYDVDMNIMNTQGLDELGLIADDLAARRTK